MKKKLLLFVTLLLVVVSVVFAACKDVPQDNTDPSVNVLLNTSAEEFRAGKFYIDKEQANSFDFSKLFVVKEAGKSIAVTSGMLDKSALGSDGGEVTCNYKGKSATAEVVFEKIFYQLELSRYTVTVSPSDALGHNYKGYFTALVNGEKAAVTDDMVTSNVAAEVGEYAYTVTFHGVSKTLKVLVEDVYEIGTYKTSISMESKEVFTYDFLADFYATKNGEETEITADCLDFSQFPTWGGEGKVICRMGSYSAEIPAKITANEYLPSARKTELTLNAALVADFDPTTLFTLTIDGEPSAVYANMLDGSIGTQAGEYTVTLTTDNKSVSVKVTVVPHEVVVAVVCYPELKIATEQAATFDCTQLFSLYVDEVAVKVTEGMLDVSSLRAATEQGNYVVTLSYTRKDGTVYTKDATVTLSDEQTISVSAVKAVTEVYPNSNPIDLSTLFVVTDNGVNVPVTSQMLDGSVNYVVAGSYTITCTYKGISATAVVTVKDGVVILPRAETISVKAGTSMLGYDFGNDFKVVVNGIVIRDINRYVTVDGKKVSETDEPTFVVGEYVVTVTIPYNDQKIGTTGSVKFTNYTSTVTYVVVNNTYRIDILQETVVPDNAANYNPFSNIKVYLNGQSRAMTLTDNPSYVDQLTLYAVVVSGYDPTKSIQTLDIDVYVNGVKNAPVRVSFVVEIHDKLEVTATDKLIFSGETLYTTDLFAVVRNGQSVTVTADMVSGKVDVFTPGTYTVTIRVDNVVKTAHVTVLDKKMAGTYKTKVLTVASDAEYDDDGELVSDATAVRLYADLVVGTDASLTIGKNTGAVYGGADDYYLARIGTTEYKMYYDDGIVVLVPVNELKMSFSGTTLNRVLTYVSEDMYDIETFVIVNNQSSHVINFKFVNYFTVEAVRVRSKADGTVKWYAARTGIKETYGADIVYNVTHGEITFNDGFEPDGNVSGSYVFGEETNSFTVGSDGYTARVSTSSQADNPFAGRNFVAADGSNAKLIFEGALRATYTENGKVVFQLFSTDFSDMKHGGALDEHTFFAYAAKFGTTEVKYFSYKFSIQDNKFTVLPKDSLFGYYVLGDKCIFLDGYGTGFAHLEGESYEVVSLRYSLSDNEVKLQFVDAKSSFAYGDTAEFYLSPLLNVLSVKKLGDNALAEQKFVNTQIIDGAVIKIGSSSVTKTTKRGAPDEFYDAIEVTTKDGAWTLDDKKLKANIDVSTVEFTKAGVYCYKIKVEVGGKTVSSNFMVEVLAPIYSENELIGAYTKSPVAGGYSLVLDEYGQAVLTLASRVYEGQFDLVGQTIVARVRNSEYGEIVARAEKLFAGTLNVSAPGFGSFVVTKGSLGQSGNGSLTLFRISYSGQVAYYLSIGTVLKTVEPQFGSDDTVVLTLDGTERLFKIASWNSSTSGLVEADGLQGSYNNGESAETLIVDGFGSLMLGTKGGTYIICEDGSLFITFADGTYGAVRVANGTYRTVDIPTGEQLVIDKVFRGSIRFCCGNLQYVAETAFMFNADGTVVCKSASPMHDEDEDYMCEDDVYDCVIGNASGVVGAYEVNNLTVTIQIGGQTIVFTLNDPLSPNKLTCTSSTMNRNMHGGIVAGDVLSLQR